MKQLDRFGVDPIQFRALFKAALKIDFGTPPVRMAGARRATSATSQIALMLFIYGIAGVSPAMFFGLGAERLLSATVLTSVVGFMVLSSLLIGDGASVLAPSDYQILGHRPITSRTYLAVRIASLCSRTLIISASISMPSALVLLISGGGHAGLAATAVVVACATGVAVTFATVAMYGWLLEAVGADQVLRYSVYVQLAASAVTWGGFLLTSRGLQRSMLTGLTMTGNGWWQFYPGAWFADWVAVAGGSAGALEVIGATLSLVAAIVLVASVWGKLSFDYADRVSQLLTTTRGRATATTSSWLGWLTNETRAVAILVRSQLRNNMRFRLGVASILPITIIYMFMGGLPHDPFLPRDPSAVGGNTFYIQIALMFLPQTLRRTLVSSDTHQASWIFYTTPADRAALVLSARNVITIFFLIPYVAVITAIFAYAFGNIFHALLHGAFIGTLSFLVLEWEVAMYPRLPFSMPLAAAAAERTFLIMIVAIAVGTVFISLLGHFVYPHPAMTVGAAAGLMIVAVGLDRLTRSRARRLFPEALA